jgi:hypothetical protein
VDTVAPLALPAETTVQLGALALKAILAPAVGVIEAKRINKPCVLPSAYLEEAEWKNHNMQAA